jgi:transcription elongation factor Elf1
VQECIKCNWLSIGVEIVRQVDKGDILYILHCGTCGYYETFEVEY